MRSLVDWEIHSLISRYPAKHRQGGGDLWRVIKIQAMINLDKHRQAIGENWRGINMELSKAEAAEYLGISIRALGDLEDYIESL